MPQPPTQHILQTLIGLLLWLLGACSAFAYTTPYPGHTFAITCKAAHLQSPSWPNTYNSAGNPTSVTYPSGRVISITYANGLPSAINVAAPSGAVTPVISGLTYTPDGQAQRWQWHLQTATGTAGTTTTTTTTHQRSYDPQGRLTRRKRSANPSTHEMADLPILSFEQARAGWT